MHESPTPVSILCQGAYLIASIHAALDDTQMTQFRHDLVEAVGVHRARGVIIDVAALDVLDSFGARTVYEIAQMARLRGAAPVIVGIEPEVAYALVSSGIGTGPIATALDLEDGLDVLHHNAP